MTSNLVRSHPLFIPVLADLLCNCVGSGTAENITRAEEIVREAREVLDPPDAAHAQYSPTPKGSGYEVGETITLSGTPPSSEPGPSRTTDWFAQLLIKHCFMDEAAWYDPEGYNGGRTAARVALAWREIESEIASVRQQRDAALARVKELEAQLQVVCATIGRAKPLAEANATWRLVPSIGIPPLEYLAHNPAGLTSEQIGVAEGWRLLDEDEIEERNLHFEIQKWSEEKWDSTAWAGNDTLGTYRTKMSRSELAKLP